ncbi:MAG TPA: cytochrome c [Pseudolabrys sp.]|nr:cytochrome c [Pseudolabrys sp.]
MSTHKLLCATVIALLAFTHAAFAQVARYGFGSPATSEELSRFFSIPPDGHGLPPGSGNAAKGAQVYAGTCAACHGEKMEGNPAKGIGGDRLLGGRGTLASKTPVKTVESYWPYATTLFDYVKRAMPFNAPGSLSDDDVYSVVAYILSEAKIIRPDETLDAKTLPKVVMPNRDGFEPDPRPELQLYR